MNKCCLFLILIITISFQTLIAQKTTNGYTKWYINQFAKADSIVLEGLPRDAEPIYDLIFKRSRSEKNYVVQLSVINNRMVNKCYYQENALLEVIEQLKADMDLLEFPVDQVAHSILGNLYWQYYQQNRWRIHQRTGLKGDAGHDIQTWDVKRIVQEVLNEFDLSLQNSDRLFNTPIGIFKEMMDDDGEEWRPTVLDLLAHRAINIYKNAEVDITSPVDMFTVNDAVYFSSSRNFGTYQIPTNDTTSLAYKAVKTYQLLSQYHLNDSTESALFDLDLNRLEFIHSKSTNALKDTLYKEALQELAKTTQDKELKIEASYRLARFVYTLESGKATNYYLEAMEICNSTIKEFPNQYHSHLINLKEKINEPELSLESERLIGSGRPSLVKLNYKNVDTAYFRVHKINLEWVKRYEKYRSIDTFKTTTLFAEWKQALPKMGDYRQHQVEVPVGSLTKGFYAIVVSDKEEMSHNSNTSVAIINVTDLFLLSKPLYGKKQNLTVFERASGITVEGAAVAIFSYDYTRRKRSHVSIGQMTTDKQGMATFAGDSYTYSSIVSYKGDTLYAPNRYQQEHSPYINRDKKTVLYTDRGIYRPGQTVHFKGLMLVNSGDTCQILSNQFDEVVLYDPNGQELSTLDVKSNEFGTYSGSFTIPTGLLNGEYTLECDDGEQRIRVEEYKRPTFEVSFKPVLKSYSYNDSVKIEGFAKAYAGYPIDNAKIAYRIERKTESRWRWYWSRMPEESKQVAVGTTESDTEGNFSISYFTNNSDIQDKDQIYAYTLIVDVTDANGETRSATHTLRVSSSPLLINAELPEVLFAKSIPEININTSNINGSKVNSDISISIRQLAAPGKIIFDRAWAAPDVFITDEISFRNDFPNRVYNTETDPSTWIEGNIVFEQNFKSAENKVAFQELLSGLKQGYYKVNIEARDSSNQEASWHKVVQVIQAKPQMPVLAKDWIIPVKTSGEPGEIAEFWVASLSLNTPIRYELLHGDAIVETRIIHAGKKVAVIKIPILEKYRGGFAVQFVQVAEGQSFVSLQEVKVPYTNKKLDISFISFRNKLLPGEQEQWKLSIKNHLGEKVNAEMMATLYDASLDVFAPLYWETNFIKYKNHNWHKWHENIVPRLSNPYRLANTYYSLGDWSKSYPTLQLSYNYFGGYNSHFRDLQYRLRQKIEREEQGKAEKEQTKVLLENRKAANDSLLALLKENKAELIGKTGTVKGIITSSADSSKLPGVNVIILNSTKGTISLVDGEFLLNNIPKGIWLEVSFIGYKTQYVQVLADSLSIALDEDNQKLEEIVVIGYGMMNKSAVTGAVSSVEMQSLNIVDDSVELDLEEEEAPLEEAPLEEVITRKNFNETAFFYPHLNTNDKGEVTIDFTIPEALTRWNMMGFAHTKDLKVGTINNSLITQKELAIMVNAPRFLRENDTIEFAAKVNNLTEAAITGHALIQLFDALTNKPIDAAMLLSDAKIPFSIEKGQSKGVRWKLVIPSGIQAVNYKVMAKSGQHTDGEENILPVLVNSKLVTESLPFMLRPQETAKYRFDKMVDQKSTSLRNEAYTIEFTSNPAWYAIQAMPYLMEYPYECAEQVFSRFFANSLSTTIMNSSPRISEIFNIWKMTNSQSLVSNLEKNQELKELLIQETPWLRNAMDETDRKKQLGLLFDLNYMSNNINSAFLKLQSKQISNGGFAWFDGMPDNRHITQHIITGLAQLQHLGAIQPNHKSEVEDMIRKAIKYLDTRIIEDYNRLLELARKGTIKMEDDHLSMMQIHYLYAKSFFAPIEPAAQLKEAYDYFYKQAKTYWLLKSEYAQGMISLALNRSNDKNASMKIINSLSNRAIRSKELGMFWAQNRYGYYWYEAPIETQAMLIEAFYEVAADTASMEEMKIWLLRNKQTSDWKTTKATAAACYALILRGTNLIAETKLLDIELGGKPLESLKEISAEAGTGYVKTTFKQNEIQANMGEIKVHNPNNGVAWGAAYWQYFEKLDKITSAETNLKIVKKLFVKEHTNSGTSLREIASESPIHIGDEVVVRVEIRADRAYEFVHLKDMRAAGFEPISTVSNYKYRDGLGYYESVKDASVNFFIGSMQKGVYIFEYSLRAVHAGFFSNGITTMQCMYAPEFSSHSEGIRINIKE